MSAFVGVYHHLIDLYQACSNFAPWAKNGPGGHIFYTGLYREKHEKHILIQNHKAWSLDIWYVSSPGRPLPILFKLCPWGQKLPRSGGHMFYTGLYRKNHEKSSFLKP